MARKQDHATNLGGLGDSPMEYFFRGLVGCALIGLVAILFVADHDQEKIRTEAVNLRDQVKLLKERIAILEKMRVAQDQKLEAPNTEHYPLERGAWLRSGGAWVPGSAPKWQPMGSTPALASP